MSKEHSPEADEFRRTPTRAGTPPTPFPNTEVAMRITGACRGYRFLPSGAPLLIVRSIRHDHKSDVRQNAQPFTPRTTTAMFFAVKPDDAEAYGDAGVSFPVKRFAECSNGRISVIEGPITIGIGEIMETTETVFGEENIYAWVPKDRSEPLDVSWLESEQIAVFRLCRMAEAVGYGFTSADFIKLKEFVGETIGQKIQSLSDMASVRPSRPETIKQARDIVLELCRLGYDEPFIAKNLSAIREREVNDFMKTVLAKPR